MMWYPPAHRFLYGPILRGNMRIIRVTLGSEAEAAKLIEQNRETSVSRHDAGHTPPLLRANCAKLSLPFEVHQWEGLVNICVLQNRSKNGVGHKSNINC